MRIIGIDPGKDGAIAVYDTETKSLVYKAAFPMIGKNPDYDGIKEIVKTLSLAYNGAYLEEVHAVFGASAKSTFNFGYMAGYIYGLLKAYNFSVEFVQPKIWQKKVWTTQDKVLKASNRVDPKPTSLLAVKRLFPGEDLTATERSKKPHEGIVDAALIAYYGSKDQGQ